MRMPSNREEKQEALRGKRKGQEFSDNELAPVLLRTRFMLYMSAYAKESGHLLRRNRK
jgi:hypothetical protein